MNILVIGGTRNIGHYLVHKLLELGHHVAVVNRGVTRDDLPADVERLRADRSDAAQLERVLHGRTFDGVVDNTLYTGSDAEATIKLLSGRVGHYVFISTGQIYLVVEGTERPFSEDDYDGMLMPAPKPNTFGYEEWKYGIDKRGAEDALAQAQRDQGFPYTSLRLPMVNSERDHFNRLYNYVLRLQDGGPILVPSTPNFPLRHVYAGDVVDAIIKVLQAPASIGRVYNVSQDETVSLDDFLGIIAAVMKKPLDIVRINRQRLEGDGFLPDCSPFSERWMSELDNARSKAELGMVYTPLATYLQNIVTHYQQTQPPTPASYRRRHVEKTLAMQMAQQEQ